MPTRPNTQDSRVHPAPRQSGGIPGQKQEVSENMIEISGQEAASFRIRRNGLTSDTRTDCVEKAVGHACGIQSQVHSAAQLALFNRTHDIEPDEVDDALYRDKRLIKTWAMRGTLHLIRADEAPLYLGALQNGMVGREKRWLRGRGIEDERIEDVMQAVEEALLDGPLPRQELAERLVGTLGEWIRPMVEHSWGGIMKLACLTGAACMGLPRGQHTTFARYQPGRAAINEMRAECALASLLRRYLHSHGPARVQDFAHWSGLSVRECSEAFASLEDELVEVRVGEETCVMPRDDLAELTRPESLGDTVVLLGAFEVMLLTHRDKSHLLDDETYGLVFGKGGWIRPTVMVDGRMWATWSHTKRARGVQLSIVPFRNPTSTLRRRVEEEASALSNFYGKDISVSWDDPGLA